MNIICSLWILLLLIHSSYAEEVVTGNGINAIRFENRAMIRLPFDLSSHLSKNFTFEAWINIPFAEGEFVPIFSRSDGAASTAADFAFYITGSSEVGLIMGTGFSFGIDAKVDLVFSRQWTHVAFSVLAKTGEEKPSKVTIYVNGRNYDLEWKGGNRQHNIHRPAMLGAFIRQQEVFNFRGFMDEIRLWTSYRTREQIKQMMHFSITGNEAEILAYYDCNNKHPNLLTDGSPHKFDGQLSTMPYPVVYSPSQVKLHPTIFFHVDNMGQNGLHGARRAQINLLDPHSPFHYQEVTYFIETLPHIGNLYTAGERLIEGVDLPFALNTPILFYETPDKPDITFFRYYGQQGKTDGNFKRELESTIYWIRINNPTSCSYNTKDRPCGAECFPKTLS